MGIGSSAEAQGFVEALRGGHTTVVIDGIKKNVSLTKAHLEADGGTAWHVLAREGKLDIMVSMLDAVKAHKSAKAKYKNDPALLSRTLAHLVNKRNSVSQTPLMVACIHGHDQCAAWLLAQGADPWLKSDDLAGQMSALHYAARQGSKECTQALLTHVQQHPALDSRQGCRYVDVRSFSAFTALHYAAWFNRKELVSILADHGAILTVQSWFCQNEELTMRHGSTPLHVAARLGRQGYIKELLAAYAVRFPVRTRANDPRLVRDAYHEFPFNVAMRYQHYHVVSWLHPSTAVEEIADRSDPADRILGPPKLLEIVCPIAQTLLLAEIDALEQDASRRQASGGSHAASQANAALQALRAEMAAPYSVDAMGAPPAAGGADAGALPGAGQGAEVQEADAVGGSAGALQITLPTSMPAAPPSGPLAKLTAAVSAAASAGLSVVSPARVPSVEYMPGAGSLRGIQRLASSRLSTMDMERASVLMRSLQGPQSAALMTNALDIARVERLTIGVRAQSMRAQSMRGPSAQASTPSPHASRAASGVDPAAPGARPPSSNGQRGPLMVPVLPLLLEHSSSAHVGPTADAPSALPYDVHAAASQPAPPSLPKLIGDESRHTLPSCPSSMFKLRGSLARRPLPVFNYEPVLAPQPEEPVAALDDTPVSSHPNHVSSGTSASAQNPDVVHSSMVSAGAFDRRGRPNGSGGAAAPTVAGASPLSPLLASFSLTGALRPAHEPARLTIEAVNAAGSSASATPRASGSLMLATGGLLSQSPSNALLHTLNGGLCHSHSQNGLGLHHQQQQGASTSGTPLSGCLTHSSSMGMMRALSGRGALIQQVPDMLGDEVPWQPPCANEYKASMLSLCQSLRREISQGVEAAAPTGRANDEALPGPGSQAGDVGQSSSRCLEDDLNGATELGVVAMLAELTAAAANVLDDGRAACGATDAAFEDMCGVCMNDDPLFLVVQPCMHQMCATCCREIVKLHKFKVALCPFCRRVILGFDLP